MSRAKKVVAAMEPSPWRTLRPATVEELIAWITSDISRRAGLNARAARRGLVAALADATIQAMIVAAATTVATDRAARGAA